MKLRFAVNGTPIELDCDPTRRLLDVLREDLGLKDTKEGCGEGECGACTVLLDGVPVCSCLASAAHAQGSEVLTASAVAETREGRLLVDCFDETGAVQCGFCFPGILVAAYHYLVTDGEPSLERVKEALSGNICRCTGYQRIFESVLLACARLRGGGAP
jgi:aerobic carbon-monoxide dehydrogenase small subunit